MVGRVGVGDFEGTMKEDERGEFTYTGASGKTVIDYVVGEVGLRTGWRTWRWGRG